MGDEKPEQVFEDGAQVQLKSGGPMMTVSSFGNYYSKWKYSCRWWDVKKQEFKSESFEPHELQRPSGGARSVELERG